MSIEAINEQLLRSIGVGIALAGEAGLDLRYANERFAEWFGPPEGRRLDDALEGLDRTALAAALEGGGAYEAELQIKPKRRALVIAVKIGRADPGGDALLVVECQNITRIRELESMITTYSGMVERNTRELEREKERVERLLLNLMPKQVYEEYKTFGVVTPQLYRDVSVLMLDFVGFTERVEQMDPTVMVGELNDIFTAFDRIADQFGCERIKTIGDAYLAVAGLPDPSPDHARAIAHCATRFLRYLARRNESHPHKWDCRIGIASGPVVGSVVGIQRYVYDVFGPAVNLAARLQTHAGPNTIVAHEKMKPELVEEFTLTDLGAFEVRSFGELRLMSINATPQRASPSRFA